MPTHSSIIAQFMAQNPKSLCIATKEKNYSYEQILSLIERHNIQGPIINASLDLASILNILRRLYEGKALAILNPKDPKKPVLHQLIDKHIYLLTSGTQRQKIVPLSYQNLFFSATNLHPEFNLTNSSIYALNLPLHHISGLMILLRSLMHGSAIALKESSFFKKSTHISMCTNQLNKILDKNHFPNLKALLLGGGPISVHLCQKADQLGYPIFTTYGMSEMASQITTSKFNNAKPLTMGFSLNGRQVKISKTGRILVKGKTLFSGYHNEPTPFDQQGYFKTSDMGEITKHGLIIYGRMDRCIISGAENIHLDEVEREFLAIKEIQTVKITSRKDPLYENRPVATCNINANIEVSSIIKTLQKKLLKYKIPFESDIYLNKTFK